MRLRARVLAALAATMLAGAAAVVTAPPADALLKVKCGPAVAVAAVDPIVHHNEPDAPVHQHQIFGNSSWAPLGNSANYADLLAGATTCREVADTAGYWTPTLIYTSGPNAGQVVPVRQFTAYYRPYTNRGDTGPGVAYPADVRLVSEPGRYDWTCGQNGGVAPQATVPDCTGLDGSPGETLTAHINFPSCWTGVLPNHSDGEVGDTRDNAQWAYVQGKACPATHPVRTTALRETIQFTYVGDGSDVKLSSDLMSEQMTGVPVPAGSTLHGDFWSAWNQPRFEDLVRLCVNQAGPNRTCEK